MKLLYLHQHFTVRSGSSGTRSYEFARLLHDKGHDITIICGQHDLSGLSRLGTQSKPHSLEGVHIIEISVPYSQNMDYVRRMIAFIWFSVLATWAAIRQKDVDVIFATSTPLTIAIPAIIASLINRQPFVFEVRDLWPEAPIRLGILRNRLLIALARVLEHRAYHRANHIVALSPGMKEGVARSGIDLEKITIIPNSCDNDLFDVPSTVGEDFRDQHPALLGRQLVVYTGAFGYVNGLQYLVQVAKWVSHLTEDIGFLLVGSGSHKERIIQLAQELGVFGRSLWVMPPLPRQDIPAVLSAADLVTSIFIPNSVMQITSPNKFFDGLAAGRPIAINHRGWQADLLEESGAGIVLPAEDNEVAARLIIEFLHDIPRMKQARQAARKLAYEQFDRRVLVDQLEDTLKGAVANRRN